MLPVRHLAPKILLAVNYCGRQLARGLGWAVPAYRKKEGATPHPGARKFSLLYDRWPDGRFEVRVGTCNLGSLSRKTGEICEELWKRMIDVPCLQEVRWRGQCCRMVLIEGGRYKLW